MLVYWKINLYKFQVSKDLANETHRSRHAGTLLENATAPEEGHHEDQASQNGDAYGNGVGVGHLAHNVNAVQIGQHDRAQHDQEDANDLEITKINGSLI